MCWGSRMGGRRGCWTRMGALIIRVNTFYAYLGCEVLAQQIQMSVQQKAYVSIWILLCHFCHQSTRIVVHRLGVQTAHFRKAVRQ